MAKPMWKQVADDGMIVRITCPLCGIQFSLSKLIKHRNKRHPDMSIEEFENLLAQNLKQGKLEYKGTRTDIRSSSFNLATGALKERSNFVVRSTPKIVSGGGFGLKK